MVVSIDVYTRLQFLRVKIQMSGKSHTLLEASSCPHTHKDTHKQPKPLLSRLPLTAECRLHLFCKFMLTFESTPPAPVHCSSKGCMNYHTRLYNMISTSESYQKTPCFLPSQVPFTFIALMYCLHSLVERKSSITFTRRFYTATVCCVKVQKNGGGVQTNRRRCMVERCRYSLSKLVSSWSVCQIHSATRALNLLWALFTTTTPRLPSLCPPVPKAKHVFLDDRKLKQQRLNKYIFGQQQSLLE